jgi:hypothetical protein
MFDVSDDKKSLSDFIKEGVEGLLGKGFKEGIGKLKEELKKRGYNLYEGGGLEGVDRGSRKWVGRRDRRRRRDKGESSEADER